MRFIHLSSFSFSGVTSSWWINPLNDPSKHCIAVGHCNLANASILYRGGGQLDLHGSAGVQGVHGGANVYIRRSAGGARAGEPAPPAALQDVATRSAVAACDLVRQRIYRPTQNNGYIEDGCTVSLSVI